MIHVVLTTFANAEDAAKAVRTLVDEHIIACGTILPGARSIYRWKDAVEDTEESVVLLKTSAERFPALEERLRAIHPYETPEIIAFDPTAISKDYADWMHQLCAVAFLVDIAAVDEDDGNQSFVTSRE